MKRGLILFVLLLFSLTLVTAQTEVFNLEIETDGLSEEEIVKLQKDTIVANLELIREQHQEQDDQLPPGLAKLIGNERMNVQFEGGYNIAVVLNDGKIVELYEGQMEKPTMLVTISDQVFIDAANEELDLQKALKEDEITLKGVGFFKKLKLGILKITLRMFGGSQ